MTLSTRGFSKFSVDTISSHDRVVGVQLEIGRKRSILIWPQEPEFIDHFNSRAGRSLGMATADSPGSPRDREPFDEYLTVAELLDHEASLEASLQQQILSAEKELVEVRAEWRSWVNGPGLEDARTLASLGEEALKSATKLGLKPLTLGKELERFRWSIEAVEGDESSDELGTRS